MNTQDIAALKATAHAAADAARAAILPFFRGQDLGLTSKRSDFDPVTHADRAAERAMRETIAATRPQDAILGEEYGKTDGTSGLTWVLDPIDGTRAFICGTATWGVLISLNDANGPIFGIIDQPYTGERFVGGLGDAQLVRFEETTPLAVRPCSDLSNATLLTTFPEIGTNAERKAFEHVRNKVKLTRYGLDCYAYALLALGQIDLVIEAGLQSYDIAAPIAVIEAAGGFVTNWQGDPVHDGGQVVAAGDKAMHAAAMALLNAH